MGARTMMRIALVLILLCVSLPGASQTYPAKPIRLVVGFAPGGGTDIMARAVAAKLAETASIQVVVENRPGANGNVAAEAVARAAPDGYTLLMMSVSHAISKPLYKTLKYDIEKDFQPLIAVSSVPQVVVVNPALPVSTLGELLSLARAKPGELSYASAGSGSPEHVAAEMLMSMAKIRMVHVPYKGGAAAATDLMGGQVQVGFNTMPVAAPHIRAGKLKLLAVTEEKRATVFPDAPTVAEAGLPGYAMSTWYGMVIPAGTPREAVQLLNREIARVLEQADIRDRFATLGAVPTGGTPEQFGAFLKTEIAKFGKLVAETGLKVE
jgi:tripartite-type tricarboxylate transporter receptor subunit TctC